MDKSSDAVRRRLGLAFVTVALVLLILGLTVLKGPIGKGLAFLVYWLTCIGFTGLALLNALLDAVIVRTRARREQRELAKSALGTTQFDPPDRTRP